MSSDQTLAVHPTRHRSLVQAIVVQLLELMSEQAAAEVRLPTERVLAEQLAVSRASLREALAALVQSGVVTTRGKAKYGDCSRAKVRLLAEHTPASSERELITDPLEVRRMLEPEVAARAAERATPRDLAELEQWLRLMEEGIERGERVVEYDVAFHVAIAAAAQNHALTMVVQGLADSLRESRELSYWPADGAAVSCAGHRRIYDALRKRDPEAARESMRSHLDQVESLIRATLTT